jgi:transcriptional regulator with XRE-family HTH domain
MTPIPDPSTGLNAAVAAEVRAELGRRKVSIQALADKADIPYGTLRRYVNAERHMDVAALGAIAAALDVDLVVLVQRAESAKPDELAVHRARKVAAPKKAAARKPHKPRPGE